MTNPRGHAACDARIAQLESALDTYRLALWEITRFGCVEEDERTCLELTDDDSAWCQRCIAQYVLDREGK